MSWPCEAHRLMLGGLAYGLLDNLERRPGRAESVAEDMRRNLARWQSSCSACREEAAA